MVTHASEHHAQARACPTDRYEKAMMLEKCGYEPGDQRALAVTQMLPGQDLLASKAGSTKVNLRWETNWTLEHALACKETSWPCKRGQESFEDIRTNQGLIRSRGGS